jgi:hypothetical protein
MLNDNRVLIAGGADLTVQIFATSELYNPASGSFSCIGGTTGRDCTASLHDVRFSQTATPLKNSSLVLIAGGSDGTTRGTPPNEVIIGIGTAEVYNSSSKTYTCVGGVSSTPPLCNNSMVEGRYNHIAVTLRDGRVLLAGGIDSTATVTASAELYDPATGKFTATGSMSTAREDFAGALFTSGPLAGQVLVMGGSDATGSFLASAELYNPATGKFTATGSMTDTRFLHSAMLLTSGPNSGRILVAAGSGDQTTELYDPAAETFRAGPEMTQIIFSPIVATIADGRTLFAGGATFNSLGQIAPVAGAELYDPAANRFSTTDSMNNARLFAAGAFLDPASVSGSEAGNVLIAGGQGPNSTLGSSELFVPGSSTTSAAVARSAPALTPKAMQEEVAKVFAVMHQQGTGGALH